MSARQQHKLCCTFLLLAVVPFSDAFLPYFPTFTSATTAASFQFNANKPAGAFFNPVPSDDKNEDSSKDDGVQPDIEESLEKLLKERNSPPLASQPSTINGIPTSQVGVGFGAASSVSKTTKKGKKESSKTQSTETSYIGIGEPDEPRPAGPAAANVVNDVTKPEFDDQGYTLYADEVTGEKSRVFEALVEYPCDFTLKIVGANEGTFVEEILQVVAESCEVQGDGIKVITHKTRTVGKWTSVTVEAPVKSAEMLYSLYENVDKDPRVKFKF